MVLLFYLYLIYMISYFGMGIYQPIAAIGRLMNAKRKDSHYAIGLKKYILCVTLYFMLMFLGANLPQGTIGETTVILYLFFVPWILSFYYMIHVHVWKNKNKNIEAYDQMKSLEAPQQDRLLLESYPTKKIKISKPGFAQNTLKLNPKTAIIRNLKAPNLQHK